MPGGRDATRRGRRGRRTAGMIRIAQERVEDLFALAGAESSHGGGAFSDRYVQLARRIGMRYNVRLSPGFRSLYCRGCSTFSVEGRSARTRLRRGRLVRTCLRCGRVRRVALRHHSSGESTVPGFLRAGAEQDAALVDEVVDGGPDLEDDGGEDP